MSIRVPAKAAADAIVIGGGVHGCFTALHLARLGADVVLLEQDQIGRHASGVNAGSIHHIPRIHFELPLAERALAAWEGMEEILEDDCGFRQVGYLKLIETEAEMAAADAAMARVQRHCTIPETRLDREALHDLEPGLAGTLLGGIWASRCGYASPARTMEALRRQMHAAGVTVLEGVQLDTLRRDQGTWVCRADDRQWAAPLLLNCAGAWGGTLSAVLGEAAFNIQSKFRVQVGPVSYRQFQELSPGRPALKRLVQFTRLAVGLEHDFDIQLLICSDDVPPCTLTSDEEHAPRLGWNTWIGIFQQQTDLGDAIHDETAI